MYLGVMCALTAVLWLLCHLRTRAQVVGVLMRFTIDYGCIIYGAAAQTSLQKMDRLQFRALPVCTGATKTTPTNALLIEAGETPLELRRDKMSLAYWIKLKGSRGQNPAAQVIQSCWEYSRFQRRGFGWTGNEWAKKYGIYDLDFTQLSPVSVVPPWIYPEAKVDMNVSDMKKKWRQSEVGERTSEYLRTRCYNYLQIFTDGSRNTKGYVGAGVYIPEFGVHILKRLSNNLSVFTAEMVAAIFSLHWVEEVRPDRVVICTDSVSILESIQTTNIIREDLLIEEQHSLLRQRVALM